MHLTDYECAERNGGEFEASGLAETRNQSCFHAVCALGRYDVFGHVAATLCDLEAGAGV